MRVAIIGANSYIARNMIVVAKRYPDLKLQLYGHRPEHADGEVGYRRIDVFSEEEMESAIKGCSLVYLFTGKTGTLASFDRPDEFLDINEKSLLTLLNACRKTNEQVKIVFPSTRLVYRGSGDALREEAEKEFLTPYAMQKYSCENYLKMYYQLFGIPYCILRICVPYGSLVGNWNSYGTLAMFEKQARKQGTIFVYGTGSQRRTFTYIEDICRFLLEGGMCEKCAGDIFNIGGETLSVRQAAEIVATYYQVGVEETPWPTSARRIESGDTVFNRPLAKLSEAVEIADTSD